MAKCIFRLRVQAKWQNARFEFEARWRRAHIYRVLSSAIIVPSRSAARNQKIQEKKNTKKRKYINVYLGRPIARDRNGVQTHCTHFSGDISILINLYEKLFLPFLPAIVFHSGDCNRIELVQCMQWSASFETETNNNNNNKTGRKNKSHTKKTYFNECRAWSQTASLQCANWIVRIVNFSFGKKKLYIDSICSDETKWTWMETKLH